MKRFNRITALRRLLWRTRGEAISVEDRTRLAPGAQLRLKDGGRIAIGRNCRIHHGAILETHGGDILVGDNVSLNPYCVVLGNGGVTIGADTRIAAHTVIVASNHEFDDPDTPIRNQPMRAEGVEIGRDVWIGAGAKILDGCTIGDGAVIGAGAVITKPVPPYSVCVGVPARVVGRRGERDSADAEAMARTTGNVVNLR